jgi:hypothetical protein
MLLSTMEISTHLADLITVPTTPVTLNEINQGDGTALQKQNIEGDIPMASLTDTRLRELPSIHRRILGYSAGRTSDG